MSKAKAKTPYNHYFFRNQDPAIPLLLAIQDEKKITSRSISKDSKVSTSTLTNWRSKKTKRPQFCTLVAAFRSIGGERQLARLIMGNEYR